MSEIFLPILGLCSGVISGLFGLGGGIVIVPTLSFVGYDIKQAVGISITQMVFASFFGTFLNLRKKLLKIQDGVMLGLGGILGSSFSGVILGILSAKTLYIVFFLFTFFSFYQYFFGKKVIAEKKEITFVKKFIVLFVSGCVIGLFSSTLGVGGGLLLVPVCSYFLGMSSREVVPLGLFFICFSSFSGAISLYSSGFLQIQSGMTLAIFSVIGVTLGTFVIQKMSDKHHRSILALIYVLSMLATLSKIFKL